MIQRINRLASYALLAAALLFALLCFAAAVPTRAHAQQSTPPGNPTDFPTGGYTITTATPGFALNNDANGTIFSQLTVDSAAVGTSGVVRGVMIQLVSEDTLSINDLYMVLRYDGSAVASDSFSIGALLGYDNLGHKMADTLNTFRTKYWQRHSVWSSVKTAQDVALRILYPIPFTNGYTMHLVTRSHSRANVWCTVYRQSVLPMCWNRNLRFHVSRTDSTVVASGSIPATGGTPNVQFSSAGVMTGTHTVFGTGTPKNHTGWGLVSSGGEWAKEVIIKSLSSSTAGTIFASDVPWLMWNYGVPGSDDPMLGRPEVFFRRSAGKSGFIVSTVFAFNGTSQLCFEACPRFYLQSPNAGTDGIDCDIKGTGTEDWGAGVNYKFPGFNGTLGQPQYGIGATAFKNEDGVTNGVRMTQYHELEWPLYYSNGCSATWLNYDSNSVRCRWTVVYYERN